MLGHWTFNRSMSHYSIQIRQLHINYGTLANMWWRKLNTSGRKHIYSECMYTHLRGSRPKAKAHRNVLLLLAPLHPRAEVQLNVEPLLWRGVLVGPHTEHLIRRGREPANHSCPCGWFYWAAHGSIFRDRNTKTSKKTKWAPFSVIFLCEENEVPNAITM